MSMRVDPSEGSDHSNVVQDKTHLTPRMASEIWVKPEITSFKPVSITAGISFIPGDGISNLT